MRWVAGLSELKFGITSIPCAWKEKKQASFNEINKIKTEMNWKQTNEVGLIEMNAAF